MMSQRGFPPSAAASVLRFGLRFRGGAALSAREPYQRRGREGLMGQMGRIEGQKAACATNDGKRDAPTSESG
jgi:hypothetical protein